MIDIKKLKKEDVGKWVIWTGHDESFGGGDLGRIKSWNKKYIFVVYNCSHDWDNFQNYTSVASNPKHLVFFKKKKAVMSDRKDLDEDNILFDVDDAKATLYEYSTEVDIPLKDLIFTDEVLHAIAMHWTDDVQNCPEYTWNIELLRQAAKELKEAFNEFKNIAPL